MTTIRDGVDRRFVIVDVFSRKAFAGNPLAVIPDATGLSGAQMQHIAREFNFSESTFVLPAAAESDADFRLRIFTPTREVPFAGHPNIGTAFALAKAGQLGEFADSTHVVFDELAGKVPVRVERHHDDELWCELEAPEPLTVGQQLSVDEAAQALRLTSQDIDTRMHEPVEASVGLRFMIVALRSRDALSRAGGNVSVLEAMRSRGICDDIMCYYRDGEHIHARMFAPLDGVPEDPATGSANAALFGLLTSLETQPSGVFSWQVTQGADMGRRSELSGRTKKIDGEVKGVWVGGYSVTVATGSLLV
ncbi:MAG: PhzF family phenazine biosynthesis protein [Pseudomonadota bacterium]